MDTIDPRDVMQQSRTLAGAWQRWEAARENPESRTELRTILRATKEALAAWLAPAEGQQPRYVGHHERQLADQVAVVESLIVQHDQAKVRGY